MRAIDTDVLVQLIVRDDERQTAAAEDFIRPGAWVSVLTLVEAVRVLESVHGLSAAQLIGFIAMLLEHNELIVQDTETVEAALELLRSRPSLGFSDCLALHMARKAGHQPLGTFDRTLSKIEGATRI